MAIYKNPLDQAEAIQYTPFKLDSEKYPDVEETPYGFIYNVGNQSITDVAEQNARLFNRPATKSGGFTLTVDGDEVFYPDFESAYKAAKGTSYRKPSPQESGIGLDENPEELEELANSWGWK